MNTRSAGFGLRLYLAFTDSNAAIFPSLAILSHRSAYQFFSFPGDSCRVRQMSIRGDNASEQTALAGAEVPSTAPLPRNGSRYVPNCSGKNAMISWAKRRLFHRLEELGFERSYSAVGASSRGFPDSIEAELGHGDSWWLLPRISRIGIMSMGWYSRC